MVDDAEAAEEDEEEEAAGYRIKTRTPHKDVGKKNPKKKSTLSNIYIIYIRLKLRNLLRKFCMPGKVTEVTVEIS